MEGNLSTISQALPRVCRQGEVLSSFSHRRIIVGSSIFKGTIRALSGAPLGACKGVAPEGSSTCESCRALIRGITSTLNRKLL